MDAIGAPVLQLIALASDNCRQISGRASRDLPRAAQPTSSIGQRIGPPANMRCREGIKAPLYHRIYRNLVAITFPATSVECLERPEPVFRGELTSMLALHKLVFVSGESLEDTGRLRSKRQSALPRASFPVTRRFSFSGGVRVAPRMAA